MKAVKKKKNNEKIKGTKIKKVKQKQMKPGNDRPNAVSKALVELNKLLKQKEKTGTKQKIVLDDKLAKKFTKELYKEAAEPETTKIPHTLKLEKVETCVSALLKYIEKHSDPEPLQLFDGGKTQPVDLIINAIHMVGFKKSLIIRLCLPHTLLDESSEVCLVVPDLERGGKDYERTIEHYKNFLHERKITGISQIMTLEQLIREHDRYDLQRQLVNKFDMFLADGRISAHVQSLLGRNSYRSRKFTMGVKMDSKNLKGQVERALSKTSLLMNGYQRHARIKVGHTNQSSKQIAENIMYIADGLVKYYPGGWGNIEGLRITAPKCLTIPIYLSLKNYTEVPIPSMVAPLPKKAFPARGTLSTMPGVRLKVMPSGQVIVYKMELRPKDKEMGVTEDDFDYNKKLVDAHEDDDNRAEDKRTAKNIKIVRTRPIETLKARKKRRMQTKAAKDSETPSLNGDYKFTKAAESSYLRRMQERWDAKKKKNPKKKHSKRKNPKKTGTKDQNIKKPEERYSDAHSSGKDRDSTFTKSTKTSHLSKWRNQWNTRQTEVEEFYNEHKKSTGSRSKKKTEKDGKTKQKKKPQKKWGFKQ